MPGHLQVGKDVVLLEEQICGIASQLSPSRHHYKVILNILFTDDIFCFIFIIILVLFHVNMYFTVKWVSNRGF